MTSGKHAESAGLGTTPPLRGWARVVGLSAFQPKRARCLYSLILMSKPPTTAMIYPPTWPEIRAVPLIYLHVLYPTLLHAETPRTAIHATSKATTHGFHPP